MCLSWFSVFELENHMWECQVKIPCLNRIVEVKTEIKEEFMSETRDGIKTEIKTEINQGIEKEVKEEQVIGKVYKIECST